MDEKQKLDELERKQAKLEKEQAILEKEQEHLGEEIRELSRAIDKLTIAVNGILQKGSNNWDKLIWLVLGVAIPYVLQNSIK